MRGHPDPREAELGERVEPGLLERDAVRAQVGDDLADVADRALGQQEVLVQPACPSGSGVPTSGFSQNIATRLRTSSACTRASSGCGGISKPRSSSSPSRPRLPSGLYSLSMQNSARCVLPVRSVSRCRSDRSTTHGSRLPPFGLVGQPPDLGERDLHLVDGLGPALVEARRLAGRADEPAREEIGEATDAAASTSAGSAADRGGAGAATRSAARRRG